MRKKSFNDLFCSSSYYSEESKQHLFVLNISFSKDCLLEFYVGMTRELNKRLSDFYNDSNPPISTLDAEDFALRIVFDMNQSEKFNIKLIFDYFNEIVNEKTFKNLITVIFDFCFETLTQKQTYFWYMSEKTVLKLKENTQKIFDIILNSEVLNDEERLFYKVKYNL